MKNYFLLLHLLLVGCAQNEIGVGSDMESVRDEALHALMAERIDTLYLRIEVLAFDQNRTLPELDQDRQRTASEIAESATSLAAAAGELAQLAETLNLSAANFQRFQILAQSLQTSSGEVARAASDFAADDLTRSFTRLQGTCSSCHSLYRGR